MTLLRRDELERERHLRSLPGSDKLVYQLLNGILERVAVQWRRQRGGHNFNFDGGDAAHACTPKVWPM